MTETNRPIPGVLYGITHQLDGSLIIREQKLLKIGIGLPKGPAINVWIDQLGQWKIRMGYRKEDADKVATLKTRAAAEKVYHEKVKAAPICPYPRKIGYFTFTREVVQEDGRTQFVPDFDAIEAHGSCPTEIDVVIVDDTPFRGGYQMWSSTELQCYGDGVNAMRLIKLGTTQDGPAPQEAAKAGERYFPLAGCWTGGCPYAEETEKNGKVQGSACKPGGDLRFQLACNIRIGGTAYFHTTGRKSIQTIFASLYRIGTLTGGRLVGIPLKMTLRPFKTNHNGQTGTQFAVGLEFRAPDPATLSKRLMESVFQFHPLPAAPVKMIESTDSTVEQEMPASAAAIASEFYPEAEDPEWVDEPTPSPAAVATDKKTEELATRLRATKDRSALKAEQQAQEAARLAAEQAIQEPVPAPRDEEPPF